MKKQILIVVFCAVSLVSFAQVGVGTANPQAKLHVAGDTESADGLTPGALAAGDGVIVSRVTDDLSSGAVATTAVVGTLVFSTNGAGGFYYSTGAVWTAVGGGGAANSTAFGVDYTDAFTGTSNQLDYSAVTQNVIIATGSSGPGSNSITLPPAAANANRLISVTAAGKALLYTNADGSNTANTTTALLVSDGTIWRVLRGN